MKWLKPLWARLRVMCHWHEPTFEAHPEQHYAEMRKQIRAAVHDNKNEVLKAQGQARRNLRIAHTAQRISEDTIKQLEEAREGLRQNEIPPS